jgi:hypothetical protein
MPALDNRDRVQRFVLRARKMMAHSLVRENFDLLNDLASGTFKTTIEVNKKTGESTSMLEMTLPPEKTFESFAARLRPFTSGKESVYWAAALDALERLLSKETLARSLTSTGFASIGSESWGVERCAGVLRDDREGSVD